ncbi:MAG TPA: protease pro-enzyme activation domain-containing protein [Candidatus Dormibacteraeota bacterium]|nr:protease pro-enzyme activation domain-containing protein [Candidatus Dormibacteraeota bacterium]
MQLWKSFLLSCLASTLCFAAQSDRIPGTIDSGHGIPLAKSLHPQAQPQYDLGPADPSLKLTYMTLLMAPSPSQQKALDQLLEQQQDRSSANFHKWLTPQQFADRFGLSQNDLNKVTAWLQSEGFQILSLGGGRNSVSFSGTAAQVQRAFRTEIHNYKILGEEHFANSTPLMIPAALNGIVNSVMGVHSFLPQPASRMRGLAGVRNARPDFYDGLFVFPNFLAPGDIATIYGIPASLDGTGQKLAIVGQTDIYLSDINDFRSGFGLNPISGCTTSASGLVTSCGPTSTYLQYVLVGSDPGFPSACGDVGEADLDIEWSGATARNAQIVYVNSPVTLSADCNTVLSGGGVNASLSAVINPPSGPALAPVVSMSYGACEAQAGDLETLLQQGNAEGVTIVNSSGDAGAATCDRNPPNNSRPFSPAVNGLAVSYPASSPEVTGVGGTAISLADDSYPNPSPLWSTSNGANGGTAVSYIPELPWNDDVEWQQYCQAPFSGDPFCSQGGQPAVQGWVALTPTATAAQVQQDIWISIGGGGASNCFTENGTVCTAGFAQPTWQQGLSVPSAPAGVRYVPDVSFFAAPNFPGYIFCTALNPPIDGTSTCANGIISAVENFQSLVGGTSASSPVFAGIVALLNQYVVANGFQGTPGLGNVNPNLYYIAANNPGAFNQVKTGTNTVYCQPGTPSIQPASVQCPAGGSIGYNASNADAATGYNLVTGLGSVNVNSLAVAVGDLFTTTTTSVVPSSTSIVEGSSVTFTATVAPSAATGVVKFYNNGSTTVLGSGTVSGGTATFATSALPVGPNSIVGTYNGINAPSTSSAVTVTVTAPDFALTAGSFSPASIPAGQSASVTLTIAPVNGPATINFTNSTLSNPESCSAGLPAGALCSFNPISVTLDGIHSQNVTMTVTTAANMALPSGMQAITVTGTASGTGGASHSTSANLTITATNQSFTLTTTAATFQVAVGSQVPVNVTVANPNADGGSPLPFVGATTALPLTYTCGGLSASLEISCQVSPGNGQPTNAIAVTVTLVTTPKTTGRLEPLGGSRIFYTLLLPGLFGVCFLAGSRRRGVRLLTLIVVLGFSTLWLGACGGSNGNTSQPNPGTPPGTYPLTINATTGAPTGGTALTFSLPITLNVQ